LLISQRNAFRSPDSFRKRDHHLIGAQETAEEEKSRDQRQMVLHGRLFRS
jgi:hypothetical protein